MSLDRKINHVKSFLENGNIHDALRVYTHGYRSDLLKSEYLEAFVDGIVEIARQSLKENRFNCDSFLCIKCSEIIKDPVTLKCGHTFSKKCLLSETKNYSFVCPKCGKSYSSTYISQLKNNVTILSIVEKLYDKLSRHKNSPVANNEDNFNKMYGAQKYLYSSCENEMLADVTSSSLHSVHFSTSLGFYKKGSMLFNFGNYIEAFKALLISLTLDSNVHSAKLYALEVFCRILQNYSPSYHSLQASSHENTNLFKRNALCHNERRLRNSGSNDSLHCVEDDRSSSDEEDTKELENQRDRKDLHMMLDTFFDDIKNIGEERSLSFKIDASSLDKREFECPLCMRILWEPVTTICGHTFCRVCLERSLDHQPTCPLCKASLALFLAERVHNATEFLELAIKNIFPNEYAERKALYLEQMEEFSKAGKDPDYEIPLFVCTVALPTVPCPLHVFEPRYRLMIRQCMESGSKQFGMCGVVDDEIAEFGTLLEIREVQYFPDGRSIVDTVGRKRFRILRRGERDGYHTGSVEFLEDQPPNDLDLQCIQEKHDRTYKISKIWLRCLPANTRHQILQHFGPMPCVESNYLSSPDGPSWLWWMLSILPVETRLKVLLLSLTSLPRRLEFLYRILLHFQSAVIS